MIINMTPHDVHILTPGGGKITFPTTGVLARCVEETKPQYELEGVQLVKKTYGQVTGLPEPEPGKLYIVSILVRTALPQRKDILSPGDLVRDENGVIQGCRNLVMN